MKLYNSILSEIEESIGAMEASIDPFNILDIILITPDDNFLNIVRYRVGKIPWRRKRQPISVFLQG